MPTESLEESIQSMKLTKRPRGATVCQTVGILPFDEAAAERLAEVAAELTLSGTSIGVFDTLVAAQALSLGLVVVTNNTRHFGRATGLKVEDWL
jgi:tRNA(fMet)-specific endonuclease VapC